jgi:hypothetical protein
MNGDSKARVTKKQGKTERGRGPVPIKNEIGTEREMGGASVSAFKGRNVTLVTIYHTARLTSQTRVAAETDCHTEHFDVVATFRTCVSTGTPATEADISRVPSLLYSNGGTAPQLNHEIFLPNPFHFISSESSSAVRR